MNKITKIIALLLTSLFLPVSAYAWQGEVEYNQRLGFVNANELEVYTEGARENAPYYGARLEPTSGIYYGTVADHCDFTDDYSTCLTYIEFDNLQEDFYYPANEIIRNNNVNVMVGWNVANADVIRNIDNYSDYIARALKKMASYGKNVYVRFGGEMNDLDLGSGEEFKRAFRKVADEVHKYDNMATVWSPVDMGSLNKPYIDYYPGDEYVDWIGMSGYQIRYFLYDNNASDINRVLFMTGENAWHTNSVKPILQFMADYGISKPVMISEGGVATGNIDGEDYSWWAQQRMRMMYWGLAMRYPQIKMINYFNTQMSWEKEFFSIDSRDDLQLTFNEAVHSGAYTSRNSENKFTFTPLSRISATKGKINLYAHAYAEKTNDLTVKYFIDGNEIASSNIYPFKATLDASSVADGNHTFTAKSYYYGTEVNSKDYKLKKIGAMMRFDGGELLINKNISVNYNNKAVSFDTPPCVIADTTMVPIRAFVNAMGISDDNILYDDKEKVATIKGNGKVITLKINGGAQIDGKEVNMDVPPTIVEGRTLIPLRFISENLNCNVDYTDSDSQLSINVTSK